MFKTWTQYTYIDKYFDTLYIQMQRNMYVECIHLVVQCFIRVLTVVVYVTMDNQVLALSIIFVCTLLGPRYETNHLHLYTYNIHQRKGSLFSIIEYSNMWKCFEFACELPNWTMLS